MMKEFQVFIATCNYCKWIYGNSFEDAIHKAKLDIAYQCGYVIRIH